MQPASTSPGARPASVIVIDPAGHRNRIQLNPLPFRIGRQPDSHLVIRDSRASRNHARIVVDNGEYCLEDLGSRHGVCVNGKRIGRHKLENSDHIEFGFPDSYQLVFTLDGSELSRVIEQLRAPETPQSASGVGGNLAKLRAVLEVARTLQTSFSIQDVLNAVVDAALAATGAERGFLLLRNDGGLETRVARDRQGRPLADSDLQVPRSVIQRAFEQRRELLSMNFDPAGAPDAGHSIADLELRSVICVPLVRVNTGVRDDTRMISSGAETAGLLYLDSRLAAADLAGGNRELLQTLAIEASTVLENARLLEEERLKHKIEEELEVARSIQQNLLPRRLPDSGWFCAQGSSTASHQVGGDYYDVIPLSERTWAAAVADVAGKGVSSALLASLLQGAFLTISEDPARIATTLSRINEFLAERTEEGKYATIFHCLIERSGGFHYVNAGHCAPLLLHAGGQIESLEPTAMPAGLLPEAEFAVERRELAPGDRLIVHSDGVTEAQSPAGEFFGRKRLRESIARHAGLPASGLHEALRRELAEFTLGAPQVDDVTLLVLEYRGPD
ncbi:MAG: FHA domain-containing protein [Acidobacteria bacterium]|nr:FHA domain-containing protein [Acidobacteriota bacterium]